MEIISNKSCQFAIIIRQSYSNEGIKFFTPNHYSQQLGYMKRPASYQIAPHMHNIVKREVSLTQEVLLIKSGSVRIDFYDESSEYVKSTIVNAGDVVLLANGGHGFTMLEESEIIEIKQGPYLADEDKVHFKKIDEAEITYGMKEY